MVGPSQDFYNAALMLLAYTPVEELSGEQRFSLATDMALASITGENIYNFGEVIATPILNYLVGTPNQWLYDIVISLNNGDIDKFNLIVDANKASYFAQPSLASSQELVKQKVVLLSVMNLIFERPSHDREIDFNVIAEKARIPLDQVREFYYSSFNS